MRPIEVVKDFFFLERGFLNGNHFVCRCERPVLVDTAYISNFDDTARLIGQLGIDLRDVGLIVTTHTHCDHIGGNRYIQEKSGCEIALHAVGKHFIDTRDDWSTWWKYYNQKAEFFDSTLALNDGDTISIGPHEFEVVYTPGHASDGIVLYHPREKILLSSDTLWEDDMAVFTLRIEGSRALFVHQESLERLSDLDIKGVFPGHGRPFTGVKEAISRAKKRVEGFLKNRQKLGDDVLKKIIIYTILMHREVEEGSFFEHLMGTLWFPETVSLYFDGEYQRKYVETLERLLERNLLVRRGKIIYTTVRP